MANNDAGCGSEMNCVGAVPSIYNLK